MSQEKRHGRRALRFEDSQMEMPSQQNGASTPEHQFMVDHPSQMSRDTLDYGHRGHYCDLCIAGVPEAAFHSAKDRGSARKGPGQSRKAAVLEHPRGNSVLRAPLHF